MHPAGLPQLPHPGIDDRVAGLPALPGPQADRIVDPGKSLVVAPQRSLRRMREVVEEMGGKLAPAELPQIGLGAAALDPRRRPPADGSADRMPHAPRRNLAEVEVRAQGARAVVVGPIAIGVVAVEVLEEAIEPDGGCGFAGRPPLAHPRRPVDRGEKVERGDRDALGRLAHGLGRLAHRLGRQNFRWRGFRLSRLVARKQRPPERREHLIGLPLLRRHMDRLEELAAIEALGNEPLALQGLLDGRVAADHGRLVATVPGDMRGAVLPRHGEERRERRPTPDQERCPLLRQRRRKALERPMEPPPARGPRLPRRLFLWGMDEEGHDRPAGDRGAQARLVVEAQVVAKPDNRDVRHGS